MKCFRSRRDLVTDISLLSQQQQKSESGCGGSQIKLLEKFQKSELSPSICSYPKCIENQWQLSFKFGVPLNQTQRTASLNPLAVRQNFPLPIIIQMGAICCPQALEPPSPQHQKCRRMLQALALALLPMAGLAGAAADNGFAFQIFVSLFLIFFLFLAWRTFSWCTVLFFLLYSLMSFLQSTIAFAGYIQYSYLFEKKHIAASIFLLYSTLFYLVAIPLSHFAYRVFKSDNTNFFVQPQQPDHDANEGLVQRAQPQPPRNNPNRNNQPDANNNQPNYFRGEAVRIG